MDSGKSPKDSDESDGDDSDYLAGFDLDKEVEGYLENLQSIPIELLRPKDDEKLECTQSKSKEEEEEGEPNLYSIVKSTLEAKQIQEQDGKAHNLEKIDSEDDDEDNLYRVTENIQQLAKYAKDKKLVSSKEDNSNSGLEAISDNDLAGDDIESGEYYSSEEEGALSKSDPQVVDMDISDGEVNVDHKPAQRSNHMFDDIKTLSITVSNSLAYEKSLNNANKKTISKEEYEKNKVILEEYYRKCDLYLKQMMKKKGDKKKKKSKNSKKLKSIVELPKIYTKFEHGTKLGVKKDKDKIKHLKERGRPSLKLPEKKRRSSHNKGKKSEHKYKLPEKINKKHKHYKKYVDYVKKEYKKKHYEEKKNLKKVTKELEKQGLISQNGIHNIKKFTNSQKKDKFIPVLSFSDFCRSRELSPDAQLQSVDVSKPENEIEVLDLDSRDSSFDIEAQNVAGPASNEDDGELFVTYSDLVKQDVFNNDPRMKGLSVFQQALFKIRPSKGIPFLQDDHQEVERISPKKPNYTSTLSHSVTASAKANCDILNEKKSVATCTNPAPVNFHNKALSNIIGGALGSDKETLLAKSTTASKLLSRSRSRSPNLYRRKSSLSGHSKSRSKSPTRSRTPPRAYRKRRVRSRSRTREKKRHKASSSPEFKHHLVYRPQRIRRSFSRSPSLDKWLPRSRSRSRSRPRYKTESRSKHVARSRTRSISRSRSRKNARNRSRPRSKSRSRSRTRYRYRSPKVHRTPPPEPDRRYRRRSKSPFKSFADQLRSKLREENEKALAMLRKTIDQAAVTCKNAQAAAKITSQESTSTRVSLDNPTQKFDKNSSVSKKYAIFKPSDLERLLPAEYSQISSCGSPSSRSEASLSPKHRIPSPPPAAIITPKIPDVSVPPPCITAPPPPIPVPTTTVSVLEEQTEQIVVTTYTNYVPFVNPATPSLLQPTPPGTITPYISPELSQYQYNNYMMPPPHMFPPQMMGRFDQEMVIHQNVNQPHFPFMNQQQFHYPMGMPQYQNTAHNPFPQTVANQSRNVSIVDISKQTVTKTGNISQWSNEPPVNENTPMPQLTWPQNLKKDQTIVNPQDASLKKDSILDQLNSVKTEQRFLNHLEGGTPPIDTSSFKTMCCVHSHFKPASSFNLKNNTNKKTKSQAMKDRKDRVMIDKSNGVDNLDDKNRNQNESDDDCVIINDTDKPGLQDNEKEVKEKHRTNKTFTLGDLDDDRIKKGNKTEYINDNNDKKIKLTLNFKPRPVKPIGLDEIFDVGNESADDKIIKGTETKNKRKDLCDQFNSSGIQNSNQSLPNTSQTQLKFPEIDKKCLLRNSPPKENSIKNKTNEEIYVNSKEKGVKHNVGEDSKINKLILDTVKFNNDERGNENVEHETIKKVPEEINTKNISVKGTEGQNKTTNENNTSTQYEDNKSEEVEKKNSDDINSNKDLIENEHINPTNGKNVELSETTSNDTNALPKTVSSNPSYKKKINLENKINKLIQVLSSSSTSSEDSKTEINNLVDNILADEQSNSIINKSLNENIQNLNEKTDDLAVKVNELKNKKVDDSANVIEKIHSVKEKTKDDHPTVLSMGIKVNDKTQTVEKKRKDATAVVNLDVDDKNKTVEKKGIDLTSVINLDTGDIKKTVEKTGKDNTVAVLTLDMDKKESSKGDLNKISTRSKSKSKERNVNKSTKSKMPVTKSANTLKSQLLNKSNLHSDETDENSQIKYGNKVKTNTEDVERNNSVPINEVSVLDHLNCSSLYEEEKETKESMMYVLSENSLVTAALQNRKSLKNSKDSDVNVGTNEVQSTKSLLKDSIDPEVQLSGDESSTTSRRTRGRTSKNTVKETEENVRTSRGRSCKNKAESTTKSNSRLTHNEVDDENILEEILENNDSSEIPKETKPNKRGRKKKVDETKLEGSVIDSEIDVKKQNTTRICSSDSESKTLDLLNDTGNDSTLHEGKSESQTPADKFNQEMNIVSQTSDRTKSESVNKAFESAQTKEKTNKTSKSKKGKTVQDQTKDSETDLLSLELNVVQTPTQSEVLSVQPAVDSERDNRSSGILPETDVDSNDALVTQLSKNTRGRKKNKPPLKTDKKHIKETTKNAFKSKIEHVSEISSNSNTTIKINNYKDGLFPTNLNKKSKSEALQNTFYFPKGTDLAQSSMCNIDLPVEKPCPLSKKSLHYITKNFLVQRAAEEEEHRSVVKGLKLKTLQLKLARIDDNPLSSISIASNKIDKKSVGRNKRKVSGNKQNKKILHVHNIIDSYAYSANTIREYDSHFSNLEGEEFQPEFDESDNNPMSNIVICDVFSMSERQSEMMSQNIDLDDSCGLKTNFLFTHDDESNNGSSIDKTVDSCISLGKVSNSRSKNGSDFNDEDEVMEQKTNNDENIDKIEDISIRYNGCNEFPKGDSDEPKTNTEDVIITNIKSPLHKLENINEDVSTCTEKPKGNEKKNIFQELSFTDFFSDQDEGDVISIKNSCEKIIKTLEAKISDNCEKMDSEIFNNAGCVDKIDDLPNTEFKKTSEKEDCKEKSLINLSVCCNKIEDKKITNNITSEDSVQDIYLDCANLKFNESESSISSKLVNKGNNGSFPEKELPLCTSVVNKEICVTNLSKCDSILISEKQNESETNISSVGTSSKQLEAVGNNKFTTDHTSDKDTKKTNQNRSEIMPLEDNKLESSSVEEVQSVSPITTGETHENKLMNNIYKASIVDKSLPRDSCENHKSVINILKSFRERPQPEQTEKKSTSLEILQNETVINVVPLNVYLRVIEKQVKTKVNKINIEGNTEEPLSASLSSVGICGDGDKMMEDKLEEKLAQNIINKQASNSSDIEVNDRTQENVIQTESSDEQCVNAIETTNSNKTDCSLQIDESNSEISPSPKDKESNSVDLFDSVIPAFILNKKKGRKKKSTNIETKVNFFPNLPSTSTPKEIKNDFDVCKNEQDKPNSSLSENVCDSNKTNCSLQIDESNSEVSHSPKDKESNSVDLFDSVIPAFILNKKKGRKKKSTKIETKVNLFSNLLTTSTPTEIKNDLDVGKNEHNKTNSSLSENVCDSNKTNCSFQIEESNSGVSPSPKHKESDSVDLFDSAIPAFILNKTKDKKKKSTKIETKVNLFSNLPSTTTPKEIKNDLDVCKNERDNINSSLSENVCDGNKANCNVQIDESNSEISPSPKDKESDSVNLFNCVLPTFVLSKKRGRKKKSTKIETKVNLFSNLPTTSTPTEIKNDLDVCKNEQDNTNSSLSENVCDSNKTNCNFQIDESNSEISPKDKESDSVNLFDCVLPTLVLSKKRGRKKKCTKLETKVNLFSNLPTTSTPKEIKNYLDVCKNEQDNINSSLSENVCDSSKTNCNFQIDESNSEISPSPKDKESDSENLFDCVLPTFVLSKKRGRKKKSTKIETKVNLYSNLPTTSTPKEIQNDLDVCKNEQDKTNNLLSENMFDSNKTNCNFQIDESNSEISPSPKNKESDSVDLFDCVLPTFVLNKKKGRKSKSTNLETKVNLVSSLPTTSTPEVLKKDLDMCKNEHDTSNSENSLSSPIIKNTPLHFTNTEILDQLTNGNEINLTSGEDKVNSTTEKNIEDLSLNKSPILIKKRGRKRKVKEVNQLTPNVQSIDLSASQSLDLQKEDFNNVPSQISDSNEETSITPIDHTDCLNALVSNSSELLENEVSTISSTENTVVFDSNGKVKKGRGRPKKIGRGRPKKIKPNSDKNTADIGGTVSYDNKMQVEPSNITNGTTINQDVVIKTKEGIQNDLKDDTVSHSIKEHMIESRNVIGEDDCSEERMKDRLEDTQKTENNHTIDLSKNEIENMCTVKQNKTNFVNHKTKSDKTETVSSVVNKNCVEERTKSNFVDELSVKSEDTKCDVDERKIIGNEQEEGKQVSNLDDWANNAIPSTLKRRRGRPKKSSIIPETTKNIKKKLNLRTRSSSPKLLEPLSKVRRGRSLQNTEPKIDILKDEVNRISDLHKTVFLDDTWDSSNHYSDYDFRNDYSDSESQSSCMTSKVETKTSQLKPSSDVSMDEQVCGKSKSDVDNCFSFGMEFEELLQSEPLTGFGLFSKQTVSPQTKLVKPNSSIGTITLPKKRGRKRKVVNNEDSIKLRNMVDDNKLLQLSSKDVSKVSSQNIEITSNSNFRSELSEDNSHIDLDQSTDFEHLLEKEKQINLSFDHHSVTKSSDFPLTDSSKNINDEKITGNKNETKEACDNIDEPLINHLKSKKHRKSKPAKDSAIETKIQMDSTLDPQTVISDEVTDPNNAPKITRKLRKSKLSDECNPLQNIEIGKTIELKPTSTDYTNSQTVDIIVDNSKVTGDTNVIEDNLCVDKVVSKSSNLNTTLSKNKSRKKKSELSKNIKTRVTRQSNILQEQQITASEISQIVKDFVDSSEESYFSDVSHSESKIEYKSTENDSNVCMKLPVSVDKDDTGIKIQDSKICKELCDSKTEIQDSNTSDVSVLETTKRKSLRESSPIVSKVPRKLKSLQTSQKTCEEDLIECVGKSVAGVDDRNENADVNRVDAALTLAANESIPIRKTRSGQVSKSNSRDSSPNILKTGKKTKHCQVIPTCETQTIDTDCTIKATSSEIQDLSSEVDLQPSCSKSVCNLDLLSNVPKDQFQECKRRKINKNDKDNDLLTENKNFALTRATRSSKYSLSQISESVSNRSLQTKIKGIKNNSISKKVKDLNKSESTDSNRESTVSSAGSNYCDSTLSPTPFTELISNPNEKSHNMKEDTPTGPSITDETLPQKRKKRRKGDDLSTWGQFKDIEDSENQSSDVQKKADTVLECSTENSITTHDDKLNSSNKLRSSTVKHTRNHRAETQDFDNTQQNIKEDKNNFIVEDITEKTLFSDEVLENKLSTGKKYTKKNKKVSSGIENINDCRGLDDEAIKEILEQIPSDKESGKDCNVKDLIKTQTPASSSCEIKNTLFDRNQEINLKDTLNTVKNDDINSVTKQKNILNKKSRKRTQGEVFKAECSIKLDSFVNFSEMKSIYKDLQAKIQKMTAVKLGSTIESNDDDSNNLDGAMDTDDVISTDKFDEESYICTSKMSLTENKILIVKQVKSKPMVSTDASQEIQDSLSTVEKPQKSVFDNSIYLQEKLPSNQHQTDTTQKESQPDKNVEENLSLNTSIVADFDKANSSKIDQIIKLKQDDDGFGSIGQKTTPKDKKVGGSDSTIEKNSNTISLGAKKRRLQTSKIGLKLGPSTIESVEGERTRTRRSCAKKTGVIINDVPFSSEVSCVPNVTDDLSSSNKEVDVSDEVKLWNRISGFLNKDSRTSVSKKMSARKRKL